ncbi:MAG: hypothetical protein KKA67_13020 [Spirochaetes bacterium]|nr:hypothetical protein [Spirochaetota bacterium]MBU1081667.1 hypothetical protein [Spirochaetota bacterium]
MREFVDQGIKSSKDLVKQAGDKAQQWGEMGVLKLEIVQLRSQSEKLTARLGAEVYEVLVEKGQKTVGKDSPAVRDTIDKIEELQRLIDAKEEAFKKAGGKEEDLTPQ